VIQHTFCLRQLVHLAMFNCVCLSVCICFSFCCFYNCMYIIIGYQLWWTFLSGSLPFSCYFSLAYRYQVFMLDARNCHKNVLNNSLATTTVCVTWYRTCEIRQLLIVWDLQTNSQLFLQGLIGLKIRLCYALANYQSFFITPDGSTKKWLTRFLLCDSLLYECTFIVIQP